MPELASLLIAEQPGRWGDLGFAVDGDCCWVGGVAHLLLGDSTPGDSTPGDATPGGLAGWTWRGARDVAGLPDAGPPRRPPAATPAHPNGVVALDHVVLTTADLDGTVADLERAGLPLRRTPAAGTDGRALTQAFFLAGPTVLEVVGPRRAGPSEGPSASVAFYGLAFAVADLDATAAFLGDRLGSAGPAVQPGRRIATLRAAAGTSVRMAFLSPRPAV